MARLYSADFLIPGRGPENPAPTEHRGHDMHLGQLLGPALEGVAIEDDEVGQVSRQELPAPALVAGEPGGRDTRGVEGLLDGDRLLRMPRIAFVERAQDTGADPEEGVELRHRRIGPVRNDCACVEEGAEGIGTVAPARPVRLRKVAIRGGVAELHRCCHSELGEARHVFPGEELRVLDPLAEAAGTMSSNSSRLVISTPEPSMSRAVWEPSVPSMNALM
jgi:hypothetical protein